MKPALTVVILFVLCSCKNNLHRPSVNGWLLSFDSLSHQKNYTAALAIADDHLSSIRDLRDSLPAYVNRNFSLYDSAMSWGIERSKVEKYYWNIISKKDLIVSDTALSKDLLTVYYRTGINHYSLTSYDDTTVAAWENYLLLEEKLGLHQLARKTYVNMRLGIQYNIVGDIKRGLEHYSMAAKGYAILNDNDSYAACINNKAIALNELRRYDSSIKDLQHCLQMQGIDERTTALQLALLADAELQEGMTAEASRHIKESLAIIDAHTDTADASEMLDRRSQVYFVKYKIEKRLNGLTGSFPSLRMSLAMEQQQAADAAKPRQLAKRLLALGSAYMESGQYDSAMFFFHKALKKIVITVDSADIFSLPSSTQLYPENTILEALDAKAGALQQLYQQNPDTRYLQTAIQCYTLSFEVERKLMQYFSYDESKLLMLEESRHRSQKAIDACFQLYRLTTNNEWAEKAFGFAEKNKSFVLLESVKRNLAANAALQNDTLYQKAQSLQLELAFNERSLAATTNDTAKTKQLQQKNKLENDLLFAKTALGRQSNVYKAVMEKEDSISAALVSSSLLNEHTGLIEFFSADSTTYAFVLNKGLPMQFIQYNAAVTSGIDSLLLFFKTPGAINNDPQDYQRKAHQLYSSLKLEQMDKGWNKLIVIPDGPFNFLPFDALITMETPAASLQQAAWFLNNCNTVYGYSAAILLKQQNDDLRANESMAVFAPVFAGKEKGQQPLLYTEKEAEGIGQHKSAALFVKEKATLANFREQFAGVGILHIASHAYADTGGRSDPRVEFIDSSLLLNELYALHSNASLIVLSACETGIGQLNRSEGPMSLARGFYYAGARNVITSYWSVDDKSTSILFNSFYKDISNYTSADALYTAKKAFIKDASASFASPYYWAGFVHYGLPQEKQQKNYWWWLLALTGVLGIYYWVKRK